MLYLTPILFKNAHKLLGLTRDFKISGASPLGGLKFGWLIVLANWPHKFMQGTQCGRHINFFFTPEV
jgi:hypothetical protein